MFYCLGGAAGKGCPLTAQEPPPAGRPPEHRALPGTCHPLTCCSTGCSRALCLSGLRAPSSAADCALSWVGVSLLLSLMFTQKKNAGIWDPKTWVQVPALGLVNCLFTQARVFSFCAPGFLGQVILCCGRLSYAQ